MLAQGTITLNRETRSLQSLVQFWPTLGLRQGSIQYDAADHDLRSQVMVQSYQSRKYQDVKDLDQVYEVREKARKEMRELASPETFRDALCRLLPNPCRSRYTIITMQPSQPILQRLVSTGALLAHSTVARAIAVAGAAVVGLFVLRFWLRLR